MNKFLLTTLLLLCTLGAAAQSTTITGVVRLADDPEPAIGAMVQVNAADSARLTERGRVVATDIDGKFRVVTRDKAVTLTISYLGYTPLNVIVPMDKRTVDLGSLTLAVGTKAIESVTVVGQAAMSMVKDDTLQFNAAAFKTHPDATAEDLLKKMPGVITDDDGNLEAQGEKITKIYVNGKEYFEDDPSLALKSLNVDAVESVQLFDDMSDDAKFSGFDDGQRIKAINIVTKRNVMNSTSGRATVGYGQDGRYIAGLQVNKFGDVHNFTIVGQVNNVNRRDYSPRDITGGGGGGGGGRSSWSGNTADLSGFTTPTWGGIAETYMLGGSYSGKFEKVEVTSNYFYSGSNADRWSNIEQNYLTQTRDYFQADSSMGYSNSHRLFTKVEWNPAETDRLTFQIRGTYDNNMGTSSALSETFLDNGIIPANASSSYYRTRLERMSGEGSLWWQRRLSDHGRMISVGGVVSGNSDNGDRNQFSQYSNIPDMGAMVVDTINLLGLVNASGYSVKGNFTYAEPLSKNSRVMATYMINYNESLSDNKGLSYDQLLQDYSLQDTSTTNYINRDYITHLGGLGYNFALGKAFNLTANVNYQYATLNNSQITPLYDNITKNDSYGFEAVLPSLSLSYSPSERSRLKVDYMTNSIFPSVTQLQNILNTTNPLQVSGGNPDLKQSYSHQLTARYNLAIPEKNFNFNVFVRGTLTSDYIAMHRRFITQDTEINGVKVVEGAQYSTPVNLQGYANAMLYTTLSFGIKPLSSNMSVMGYYRYANTPSISDNVEYTSISNRMGMNIQLTSNISENVDFTLAYRPGVSLTEGGVSEFDRYFSHDIRANANIIFLKNFFINGDVSWRNTFGTLEAYEQHYAMVNAAIGAKFLKDRSAEIRFGVYDALDQNKSIWQYAADTYTQLTESQVLGRYYMVTLSFKFDTRKNKSGDGRRHESGGGKGSRHMM